MKRFRSMNAYTLDLDNGATVFVSYSTPIAIVTVVDGVSTLIATLKKFSQTTSKQLSFFIRSVDVDAVVKIPNNDFKDLLYKNNYLGNTGWL